MDEYILIATCIWSAIGLTTYLLFPIKPILFLSEEELLNLKYFDYLKDSKKKDLIKSLGDKFYQYISGNYKIMLMPSHKYKGDIA